jgi:nitrogen fixation/metabolism regulation signal transduction histidine kinase
VHSEWCHFCGAPQGLCQHCNLFPHRYVEKKCDRCGEPFMYRLEYERKKAAKSIKKSIDVFCYLTVILVALLLAIYVAVKVYSFIVK